MDRMRILFLMVSLFPLMAFGQEGYYVTKDNQKIPYLKELPNKEKTDQLILKVTEEQERAIKLDSIFGYFIKSPKTGLGSPDKGVFHYMKSIKDEKDSVRVQYLERRLSGRINLYSRTTYSYGYQSVSSTTNFYLEKNNQLLEHVFTPNAIGQNKKKKLELLQAYVGDNEKIAKSITEKFTSNFYDSLFNLVRRYNLAEFNPDKNILTSDSVNLTVYSDKGPFEQVLLIIGGKSFNLKSKDFVTVKMPSRQLIKICIDGVYCEIIELPPHFNSYFEIVSKKTGKEVKYSLVESPTRVAQLSVEAIAKRSKK